MKVAVIGGGPGGLYLAALVKQLDASAEITVWERNAADDTFGFGVVFSDETLGGIENADPYVAAAMEERFARWTDIDIVLGGRTQTVGGQGFAAMGRKDLLGLLQERCRSLGIDVRFRREAPPLDELRASHDLVVAADGSNSAIRAALADRVRPSLDERACRYMWLGLDHAYEAFTFVVKQTPYGVMQLHGYPYAADRSTFIVEMHDDVWRRAGFDALAPAPGSLAPGESDEASIARIHELFADELADTELLANNSRWLRFTTVRNAAWHDGNVVLLGDAAHTAHFSIGSGTKLAMEDALALAACLHEQPSVERALSAYEQERRPVVESTQRAAQASLEWFEQLGQYSGQGDVELSFNLLTRSRRITFENLRVRDPEFAALVESDFAARNRLPAVAPAMFQPVSIGSLALKNRVIVSAMDMYRAVDGVPEEFHLVHLGARATGGAGLVMTEMVCVSPEGRITPGCSGLWSSAQQAAWARIVDYVHTESTAAIGAQIGHSGRKGSTKLMWEGIDEPLPEDNWELMAPSSLPYASASQTPREMTRADMDRVREEFVAGARRAGDAGFDLLELHCAHGYLLSSFLSPLTNRRKDGYGGSQEARLRYPLEVFDAVRAAWPSDRPLTVRLSAVDWADGGSTPDDAVAIARAFVAHGADAIDVSSGQVVSEEEPAYGRSYQTPFADRIRNEVCAPAGVAVIAVGAIASWDDVNSILLAGRADLCALARPHLYDPHWTLHAAAEQGYTGVAAEWVAPYRAGSRRPPGPRTDAVRPRLELIRAADAPDGHVRWQPGREPATMR